MGKTKNNAVEEVEEAVEELVSPQPTKPTKSGAALFTREEIAASKDFKEQKWLVYAVIKKDECVTKAEAQRRVTAFLNKEI